jgi:hypothetical protein
MTAISPSTQRRLLQLPQLPTVWEGDRRKMVQLADESELEDNQVKELIVWVDGVECLVRSMEVVNETMGSEAIVRALIKAMEAPQAPSQPARPQKIIVRDRQLQFYLRGVLQDLEIVVEYISELPIIDELFSRFSDMSGVGKPKLPRKYLDLLNLEAREIWNLAPWAMLADYEVISIELNHWDIEKLYVSVMGMLGMEYGILLYRSVESLQRFRSMALNDDEAMEMESAFLSQDCIFLTFEALLEPLSGQVRSKLEHQLDRLPAKSIEPSFGNIHPMEGMRPFLYEEEAIAACVALAAFKGFLIAFKRQLQANDLPRLTKRIEVRFPDTELIEQVTVETLPELSAELLEMHLAMETDDETEFNPLELQIKEDLIPDDSFIKLGIMPWDRVDSTRRSVMYHQTSEVKAVGAGLPIITIQTTRSKAAEIVDRIQSAGGLLGICFNPIADPDGANFELGILQLADGEMQLFGEFYTEGTVQIDERKDWHQHSRKTKGYCGLIIAHGLTGKARENPGIKETIAFLETKSLSNDDLGLGTLQLMPDRD